MENTPRESNSFSASKEISSISRNPKVHYHADMGLYLSGVWLHSATVCCFVEADVFHSNLIQYN